MRGPKTRYTDACLTDHIRRVLGKAAFGGEGYRKVWARLCHEGVRAGKPRILRLMQTAGLLWIRDFDSVEELNHALQECRVLYNERWLAQRHRHRSPAQVRREFMPRPTAV